MSAKQTPKWMLTWRNRRKKKTCGAEKPQDQPTRKKTNYPKRPSSERTQASIDRLPQFAGMKPDPRKSAEETGERFHDCLFYLECIGIAGLAQWPGMTCGYCELFKKWKHASERKIHDRQLRQIADERKED